MVVFMAPTADANCVLEDDVVDEQAGCVSPSPGNTAAALPKTEWANCLTLSMNRLLGLSVLLGKWHSNVDPDTEVCVRSSRTNPSASGSGQCNARGVVLGESQMYSP